MYSQRKFLNLLELLCYSICTKGWTSEQWPLRTEPAIKGWTIFNRPRTRTTHCSRGGKGGCPGTRLKSGAGRKFRLVGRSWTLIVMETWNKYRRIVLSGRSVIGGTQWWHPQEVVFRDTSWQDNRWGCSSVCNEFLGQDHKPHTLVYKAPKPDLPPAALPSWCTTFLLTLNALVTLAVFLTAEY